MNTDENLVAVFQFLYYYGIIIFEEMKIEKGHGGSISRNIKAEYVLVSVEGIWENVN